MVANETLSSQIRFAFRDMAVSTEELLNINAEVSQFNVNEELPSFLNSVLDKAENLICADSRNVCGISTHLLVLDRTISILRLILQQVDEDDQKNGAW